MKRRLLSNVIVAESSTVLKLISVENQSLLVWRNVLFVINFLLDNFNSIAARYINRHGLATRKPDKNLESPCNGNSRVSLNAIITESFVVLKLLPIEDQSLLA